jgi:hypothetical protein
MLTEYLQGIYVSDINTAFDKTIYQKYNIDIVINCTIDFGFLDLNIKKIRIPLSNDLNYHTDIKLLNQNLNKILSFINDNYIEHNILLCCYDGLTISPIIVGLFISKYGKIPINQIKNILKSKNKDIIIELDLSIFNL